MKNIFLFIGLFVINFSFAQKIDLVEIKNAVEDINSSFYYERLLEEFQNHPSDFISDPLKSKYLYYGKLYSDNYERALEEKSKYLKFIKLTGNKKYSKAIKLGEDLREKDPVNLTVLMNLINCYKNSDLSKDKINVLESQVKVLMSAIANQGDGKGRETAFNTISLEDEFTLLNYFNINLEKYTRQSEKISQGTILDIWVKDKNYKSDHRNNIYILVLSNSSQ